MPHQRTALRGFTLVELLMVVTIIGLLMALLMPAAGAALDYANTLACQNNLKQIGVGVLNYSAQNEGFIIPAGYRYDATGNDLSGEGGRPYWCNILVEGKYLSAPNTAGYGDSDETNPDNVFRCPSGLDINIGGWIMADNPASTDIMGFIRYAHQPNLTGWQGPSGSVDRGAQGVDCWYYFNGDTWNGDYPSNRLPNDGSSVSSWVANPRSFYHKLDQIKDRSTMVMACDGGGMNGARLNSSTTRFAARHTGEHGARTVTNMVFWDGHVEAYQWTEDYRDDPIFDNGLRMDHAPYFRLQDQ